MVCLKCSPKDSKTSDEDVVMENKGKVDEVEGYSGYMDYICLYQCPKCKNVEIE